MDDLIRRHGCRRTARSIPHADADRFRGFYDLTVGLDEMEFVDGVLDGDGIDMV